ncbi:uncharacterized protein LAESUDRAFT_719915 [Laetiporus sulphureus 93-53]|uniref:Uncharacterized protein n=1 Tax=Laetiporus sulphureus 93-53 TaxID=1314785 RepID=A0A165HNF6_9APHY|nr:uncharacterized protein LAESUDRAFT_719915 [Laetiporus sulphureus 93-53]KZT11968.1 hypothetical protein LAESUDRAFT_719915 [Laetiporus sulphureus 93-53]
MTSSVLPEQPIIRPATPDDVDQIAPLFLTSLDTSLPGVSFSTRPEYALHLVRAHLAQRLFPPPASSTFVLIFPSSAMQTSERQRTTRSRNSTCSSSSQKWEAGAMEGCYCEK